MNRPKRRVSPFELTRKTVLGWALSGVILSAGGLLILELYKDDIDAWVREPLSNVLAVLFGIAAVSLVWEFSVRRSHSEDLLRYLNLGSSVARSGLEQVTTRSTLDWTSFLSTASEVTVLTNDIDWLDRNQYILRDRAGERVVTVTVAVPEFGGTILTRQAEAKKISLATLEQRIQEAADRVARAWRDDVQTGTVRRGSTLRVVSHSYLGEFEVITIDQRTFLSLTAPGDAVMTVDPLTLVFSSGKDALPASFLRRHLEELSDLPLIQDAK